MDAVVKDTGEVVEIEGGRLSLPGRVMQTGLSLPDDLTFEQWTGIGESLRGVERSLMWWLGDWQNFGERRYGDAYKAAIEATGRNYQALADAKWVAGKVEFSRRHENLSWSHHREVAALDDATAARLLDAAEAEGWSQKELRQQVSRVKAATRINAAEPSGDTCQIPDLVAHAASGAKYGCIYADPPWLYDNQGTRAATGNHYGGMTVDELCEMPVRDLAADDAHLHLWTTNGFLFDCPRIFDAWGFEFRSSFIWVKPQIGIGNYWRNSHEILLTAIRGDAKRFNDHSMSSWLQCDRGRHSAKPEQVRGFIERASPGPYLELFGRLPVDGWAVWGNQIERNLFNSKEAA